MLTPFKEIAFTGSVNGNHPLWFLFSLFIVRLVFNELFTRRIYPIAIFLFWLLTTTVLFYSGIDYLPIYLYNIPLGIAVYSCGYMLRERQFEKMVLLFASLAYLGIMLLRPSHLVFRDMTLNEGGYYFCAVLYSLSACVVFNNLFRCHPSCNILQFIGKNSMTYYVTHWIILSICSLVTRSGFHCHSLYIVMIASCLVIPTIIVKLKKKVIV